MTEVGICEPVPLLLCVPLPVCLGVNEAEGVPSDWRRSAYQAAGILYCGHKEGGWKLGRAQVLPPLGLVGQ